MKVLFITNYPSPYRVDFWNLLGEKVDLTVTFTSSPEDQHHRSSKWFNTNYSGFNAVFLKNKFKFFKINIFWDIIPILNMRFDFIILGGYTSGTQMIAIEYMKIRKIPFILEADGGFIQNESRIRLFLKRHFIGSANIWMSSGKTTTDYFIHYGANPDHIYLYPFTSQSKSDIDNAQILNKENKKLLRQKIGVLEDYMILSIGQMIYRKGVDVLLSASTKIPSNIAVCIVGGDPTEEYIQYRNDHHLNNVYFVGFKTKKELASYYQAADLFVMPTREDIWGLVINEALSYGLPIISTDKCGAALELVEDGINGFIVPSGDANALSKGIKKVLNNPEIGIKRCEKIQKYTIENMVNIHMNVFQKELEV